MEIFNMMFIAALNAAKEFFKKISDSERDKRIMDNLIIHLSETAEMSGKESVDKNASFVEKCNYLNMMIARY